MYLVSIQSHTGFFILEFATSLLGAAGKFQFGSELVRCKLLPGFKRILGALFETQVRLMWVSNSLSGLKACLILTKAARLHSIMVGDYLPRFESRSVRYHGIT